jgi:protein gp37
MTDPFHKNAPDSWIGLVFLVAALCPQHRFLLLTKRPERIQHWLKSNVAQELQEALVPPAAFHLELFSLLKMCGQEEECEFISTAIEGRDRSNAHTQFPLPNVWLGASVEDQVRADERMPIMHKLKKQGWHTFVSAEPLLEEVDLRLDQYPVDWVIIGGESGDNARPFNLSWGRSLICQCRDNHVKAFFKQAGVNIVDSAPYVAGTQAEATHWQVKFKDKKGGEPAEWEEQLRVREIPDSLQLSK